MIRKHGLKMRPGVKTYHMVPRKTPPDEAVVQAARRALGDPNLRVEEFEVGFIEVSGAEGKIEVGDNALHGTSEGQAADSRTTTPEN